MWESAADAEPGSTVALATSSQARESSNEKFVSEALAPTLVDPSTQRSAALEKQGTPARQLMAVLQASAADQDRVGELLKSLGYRPVCFESSEDLLVSPKNGVRFDAAVGESLGAATKDVPVLLMVQGVQSSAGEMNAGTADVEFIRASRTAWEVEARFAELQTSESREERNEGFHCGGYYFVPISQTVYFKGKKVKLQRLEFELARQLFLSPGCIHSRETLLRSIWGEIVLGRPARKLDVHVSNLRKKLDLGPHGRYELAVVRGVGYQLRIRSSKDGQECP